MSGELLNGVADEAPEFAWTLQNSDYNKHSDLVWFSCFSLAF